MRSLCAENGVWYPEFGLVRNPFQYFDRATEKESLPEEESYSLIRTEMVSTIIRKARSGTNAIFEGEKGCGKSSAIELAQWELTNKNIPVFTVVGMRTHNDFYHGLYRALVSHVEDAKDRIKRHFPGTWLGKPLGIPQKEMTYPEICTHPQCRKRIRCVIVPDRFDVFEILEIVPKEIFCPVYQWIVIKIAATVSQGKIKPVFLFDAPDDIENVATPTYFVNFMQDFHRETGSTIVLMTTSDQYARLKKTEYFGRWMREKFEPPNTRELREILLSRIKDSVEGEGFLLPFDERAIDYLVDSSGGNPRKMLMDCNDVLSKMSSNERKEPADVDFVLNCIKGRMMMSISEMDAINGGIQYFLDKGYDWLEVRELQKFLLDKYQIKINSKRLGRLLKPMGFEHKNTPWSAYRIGRLG